MKRYISYGYLTLALFFVLSLHKGINEMPHFPRYLSHVWTGDAPYYGIEVEYITPEEVERRSPKLEILVLSGAKQLIEKKKDETLKLNLPAINLPIQPIKVDLLHKPMVQPVGAGQPM